MAQATAGHVFMSYSRRDDAVMRRIVTHLREQGLNIWVDHEKLTPGTAVWEARIEKALTGASAVIVILSPDSRNSKWVRREISFAEQYEKPIFPVLVRGDEDTSIPIRLITNQYVDLRQNEEMGLNSLSRAISSYLKEMPASEGQTQGEVQQLATEHIKREQPPREQVQIPVREPVREKKKPAKSPWRMIGIAGVVIALLAVCICGGITFIPRLFESPATKAPVVIKTEITMTPALAPITPPQEEPPTPIDEPAEPTNPSNTPAPIVNRIFPPAIDGFVEEGEWEASYFIYELPHGILYFQNDDNYLYVLIDLTEDTGDDPPRDSAPWGDYFSFTFDVNKNGAIDENLDISYGTTSANYKFGLQYYLAPGSFTSLLSTTSQLGVGFGPSLNSSTPHRIWEFAFDLSEIQAGPGQNVRFGVTTYSENPLFRDDIPLNSNFDFSELLETNLAGP